MKPSGVQWIGEIPIDKSLVRNKYYFRLTKGKIPSSQNSEGKGVPYVGASELDSNECRNYTEDDTVPVCDKDDILILWDGARAGLVGTGKHGAISSTVVKCTFTKNVYPRFGYWYFKGFENYFAEQINGTTIPHMNARYIEDIGFITWNIHEQQVIADYLDDRCSRIDEIIAEAIDSIEEYKELKQAVIFEAVTKGLDKNVQMKDSGIDGWGLIPNAWQIIRMKNLIMSVSSGLSAITSDNASEESGYYVLRTSAVSTGEFKPNEIKSVLKNAMDRLVCPVKKNTIVMSRMNTAKMVGYCAYIAKDYDNYYLPDKLWRIEMRAQALPKYIWYLMNSNACHNHFASIATGTSSSMINITINDLMSLVVAIPDVETQQETLRYLDVTIGDMDALIIEKQSLIEDLQAYKKSLIYEVVTGKRRVV